MEKKEGREMMFASLLRREPVTTETGIHLHRPLLPCLMQLGAEEVSPRELGWLNKTTRKPGRVGLDRVLPNRQCSDIAHYHQVISNCLSSRSLACLGCVMWNLPGLLSLWRSRHSSHPEDRASWHLSRGCEASGLENLPS